MIAAGRRTAVIVILVTLAATGAWAQTPDILDWKITPGHPASYDRVKQRYPELVATLGYELLFARLGRELEASTEWPAGDPVRVKLLAALAEMAGRFSGFDARLANVDQVEREVVIDALLDSTATGLFQRVNETWFSNRSFRITVPEVEAMPLARFDDFMHRVDAAERLLSDLRNSGLSSAVSWINAAAGRWHQYVFNGRSQYPWEMALNGATTARRSTIEQPPGRQWILLHPELGVELGTRGAGLEDVTAQETLLIQAVGHVWYRWPASSTADLRWWGLSLSMSMARETRPGFGFTFHYGKIVNVGLLWHDVDRDGLLDRTPSFHTGVDLFRLARKRLPDWGARR